jgi:hypothetical protein
MIRPMLYRMLFFLLLIWSVASFAQKRSHVTSFTFSAERDEFVENLKLFHQVIPVEASYVHAIKGKIRKKFKALSENDASLTVTNLNAKNFIDFLNDSEGLPGRLLHFSGHGTFIPTDSGQKDFEATSIIKSFHFPLDELVSLEKVKTQMNPGMLVSTQCYGGSLHFLSFSQSHSCSASAVPWWRKTFSRPGVAGAYLVGFTREVRTKNFDFNRDGKTHLLEAHLAGMLNDQDNPGYGELSSWSFLDYKLCGNGYRYNRELNSQTLGLFSPDCRQSDYLTLYDSAGGFRPKGEKFLDLEKNFLPLTPQEQKQLPEKLVMVYRGMEESGFLNRTSNAARFHSVKAFMSYLRKYLLARRVLTSSEQLVLEELIDCETAPRLE